MTDEAQTPTRRDRDNDAEIARIERVMRDLERMKHRCVLNRDRETLEEARELLSEYADVLLTDA